MGGASCFSFAWRSIKLIVVFPFLFLLSIFIHKSDRILEAVLIVAHHQKMITAHGRMLNLSETNVDAIICCMRGSGDDAVRRTIECGRSLLIVG